jgi:protein-S-isoprenylcysteine O-methyltransferase Ste14
MGSAFTQDSIKAWGWWLVFVLIHGGRAVLAGIWFLTMSPLGCVLGFLEALSVGFSLVNFFSARRRDERWSGFLLPLGYVGGFLLLPKMGPAYGWLVLPLWVCAVGLVTWALLSLGRRYTACFAAFDSVCERGPYRYVRHPQAAGRVLVIYSVAFSGVGPAGCLQCVACLAFVFLACWVEESFLLESPEYVDYAERVPYRLWCGVW